MEGLMASFSLSGPFYDERCGIHAHLDTAGPVGVHDSVLVVETFQLKLKVRSPHQCLMHLGFEVKDMIGDGEVVLQSEGGQQDPVLHGEGEAQLLFGK